MKRDKTSLWLYIGLLTVILFAFFLYVNQQEPTAELLIASPYLIGLYFLIFSIGQPIITNRLGRAMQSGTEIALLFPVVMVAILYSYLWINGHSPFQGTAALFPFYILFPTLYFLAFRQVATPIRWVDFAILMLFIIPATAITFEASTNLPFSRSGFGSVLRFVIILTGVYSFSIIRGVPDIGFYPAFRVKSLFTAVWVWLAFFAFTLSIGYAGKFMKLAGHELVNLELIVTISRKLITIFFATALFEELFFRGLLQNFLARKITTDRHWQPYWKWGFGLLVICSGIVGYWLKATAFWLPIGSAVFLFLAAWLLEKRKADKPGTYTALAIVSVFFGLVHAHAGSLIFVVLAGIAGWAYGYAYLKTKNVFYAALVHTLVNGSEFIFGLELIK